MTAALVITPLLLVVLLLSRIPVAFAMIVSSFVGLLMVVGWDSTLAVFELLPHQQSTTFTLTTIPLFILMAEFLSQGKIVRQAFEAASAWFGGIRGGLAMATVSANAGFAALSGSSTAAVGSMARTTVPEMRRAGYDDRLSMGTVAASGTLAAMIPPSGAMIIYGSLTESSIAQLFIAGIIPGLLTAVAYIVTIFVWTRVSRNLVPEHRPEGSPWTRRWKATAKVWPGLLLIIVLLIGIYTGIVTPTEAGALGAVGGLIISVAFGGMRWRGIVESVRNTVQATSMILLLVVGATLIGSFLTLTRAPQNLMSLVEDMNLAPIVVVIIIVIIYLILGTFMDAIAMMVLTLPITFPMVIGLGYDPIWFGIIVIKCAEIGLITPPFGMNIFVAVGSIKGNLNQTFAGASRFLASEFMLLILLVTVPWLSTALIGDVTG